jgi:cytidylate kinase-like protein
VPVVTITRLYGAGGADVGQMVADRLGWNLLDRQLIDEVAARLQVPKDEVEERDEQPSSFLDSLLVALGSSSIEFAAAGDVPAWTPPFAGQGLDTRQAVVRLTQEVIREAARGNAVIVGRGSAYILREHDAALHAFLIAPSDFRVRVVMQRSQIGEEEARRKLKETDANRAAAIKQLYGHDWANPSHYDLVLNTGGLGFETAAELVVAAARAKLKLS